MPVSICAECGANLSAVGSVHYRESYDAYLANDGGCVTVIADAFTVESSAECSACGAAVGFYASDLSTGGLARPGHSASCDSHDAGGVVPVWCSCGWTTVAGSVDVAREMVRQHEAHPPRWEVRAVDIRHGAVDMRPDGWLAASEDLATARAFAERQRLELWNDPRWDACVWDSVEARPVE